MATIPHDLWHRVDEVAHERPELWAKCYPKMYEGIDGAEYYSAKLDATIQDTPNEPLNTRFQYDVSTDDKPFMARVAHLAFNTLQLMLARPNMVSMGSLVKRVHDQKKSIQTFWSPNTIGKDYRLKRESLPLGGTHASPRGHWVRGFWRYQACGSNYSQHKEIWIEPFWRGGE